MGRHADEARNRGIARWLIAAIVAIVLLAAATIAYFVIVNRDSTTAGPGGCTASAVLPVEASTGAAAGIQAAATAFDATAPVARSTCIRTTVASGSGPEIARGLAADWTGQPPPPPAFWAADSETDIAALDKTRSDLTAGRDAEPIGTSPVVLAVQAPNVVAVEGLSWSELADAVGPSGTVQLPTGDPLTLALPDPTGNRATAYALESAIATGQTAVTVAGAKSAAQAVDQLAGSADLTPETTADALTRLASGVSDFNAVPVVESELAAFNASAAEPLAAVYLDGPTAGDEIVTTTLTARWVDATLSEAGAAFHSYLRDPAGLTALAKSGLRIPGVLTPPVKGIDFAKAVTRLAAAASGVSDELATRLGSVGAPSTAPSSATAPSTATGPTTTTPSSNQPTTSSTPTSATSSSPPPSTTPSTVASSTGTSPTTSSAAATGPVITFLIDTSSTMGTSVDGRTRIDYGQEGLRAAVGSLGNGDVGLWSFASGDSASGYITLVPTGPVAGQVDGVPRAERLQTTIGELAPGGTRTTYAAVVAAYQMASDNAIPGRDNRVVVVTDGPDETPGVSREAVVAQLGTIKGQGKNVRLDILGVGEAAPSDALTELATAGGGSYTPVNTSPELPPAIQAAAG